MVLLLVGFGDGDEEEEEEWRRVVAVMVAEGGLVAAAGVGSSSTVGLAVGTAEGVMGEVGETLTTRRYSSRTGRNTRCGGLGCCGKF